MMKPDGNRMICRVLDTWVGERHFLMREPAKRNQLDLQKDPEARRGFRPVDLLAYGRSSPPVIREPDEWHRRGGRRGDGDESLSQRRKAPPARPLARGRVPLGSGPVRTVDSGHVGQGPRTLEVRATKRGVRQR
jgi:hypothetical protein